MTPSSARRSNRIEEEIPITLIGSDTEGRSFLEHTRTVLISRHGAGITSQYKLSPEQELLILRDSKKEANVRVIGQMGVLSELYIYGVAFLEPLIDFWDREFITQTESESKAPPLILECSRCGSRESIEHNDLEIDVFTFNQNVVRYCQACASSTVWKVSARQINDSKAVEQLDVPSLLSTPEVLAVAPTSASSPSNKRKHRRTKVDFAACIRRPGLKDDIVICEDMSRGGVRFTSARVYFAGTAIEIAVPYSKGSSSIFVPAQITHVQQLTKRKLFLCGVAFTKFNG
jgi:PilZ domain